MNCKDAKRLFDKYRWLARSLGFHAEADDIAQEAMLIKLSHNWKQTDKRTVIDAIRRTGHLTRHGKVRRVLPGSEAFDEAIKNIAAQESGSFSDAEESLLLKEVADTFEGVDRTILLMRFSYGFTASEISEHLGITREVAYRRIRDIIRKIRKQLKGTPIEE